MVGDSTGKRSSVTDVNCRDPGLRISSEHRDRYAEDVHNHGRCQIRTNNGRLVKNHNAGHGCLVVATIRYKIQKE